MWRDVLELGDQPDAVPRARSFVTQRLRDWGQENLADGAALAATELVTNALLHVGPPVRLRLSSDDGVVRLEVHDTSRLSPVRPPVDRDSMTGRGLALVGALSSRWGTEATGDGKAVWAEITASSVEADDNAAAGFVDRLLAEFDDEGEGEPRRFTVELGDVSTELLLAAKRHVDSLSREFTLAAAGALSGVTPEVPRHLAGLIEAVVGEFSEARQSIKRQALDAAARGARRTTLTLTLPAEAADAGERYLAALQEADSYARAARLLTLEAPAQHQAFRRWYVTSLVTALRQAAAGEPVTPPPTFEDYLLAEVDHLAALQRVSDRGARLQRVTAALAGALAPEEVADTVVHEAMAELGASAGGVLLQATEHDALVAIVGVGPTLAEQASDVGESLPATEAMATGEPVWVESREERDERYPGLVELEPAVVAACAVPLEAAGHRLGVLRLSFADGRMFGDDERGFLVALAAAAAQALDRAQLYDAQARATERLRRLQTVTAALTGARDVEEVAGIVVEQAVALLGAQLGAVCRLEPDGHTLTLAAMRSSDPAALSSWGRFDVDDELPASEAVRTGRVVAAESLAERDARWPALVGLPPRGEHALITLPLRVRERPIGSLTLSFARPQHVGSEDLEALTALADVCAQAMERARTADQVAMANGRLAFLARASAELAESVDVSQTLASIARLAVPEVADWCIVQLVEADRLVPLAVAHVDPAKVQLADEVQQRWPARLDDDGGAATVVRTGTSILVPEITDEMLVTGRQRDPEHTRLLQRLGLSSVIIAPLVGREGVIGALTLITAESTRHYGTADLVFAEDLARRAGSALETAALVRRLGGDGGVRPT